MGRTGKIGAGRFLGVSHKHLAFSYHVVTDGGGTLQRVARRVKYV
jgi:hypothetical protein